ncbi:MAG TPA: IS66 family transposase [Edaphocola sp.]|nr:IS66 family transposase [Edaphocola sp.]
MHFDTIFLEPPSFIGFRKSDYQTDGYIVYDNIGKREGIVHLNCWAHAWREYERAMDTDKERASHALTFIQSLYSVEREAREKNLTYCERKELRLTKSLPTLNALGKWLAAEFNCGNVLPQSSLGKAIAYTFSRWKKRNAYLYDGMLEIDNNLIENAIRPIAIGRKNYLFAGSHEGAQRAAVVYSLFAMCKMEEVNPAHWLKYVLDNIQNAKINNLKIFYPRNFKNIRKT